SCESWRDAAGAPSCRQAPITRSSRQRFRTAASTRRGRCPSCRTAMAVAPEPGVERIAVLRASALGDFIFCLPALDALRAAYPRAEIVLLALAWHAAFLSGLP